MQVSHLWKQNWDEYPLEQRHHEQNDNPLQCAWFSHEKLDSEICAEQLDYHIVLTWV